MTNVQHRDRAAGRWWEMPITEHLGNVGSEISRAVRWASRNPETARLLEIARAREVVVDFFDGSNQYHSTGASLQQYFDAFALAARRP